MLFAIVRYNSYFTQKINSKQISQYLLNFKELAQVYCVTFTYSCIFLPQISSADIRNSELKKHTIIVCLVGFFFLLSFQIQICIARREGRLCLLLMEIKQECICCHRLEWSHDKFSVHYVNKCYSRIGFLLYWLTVFSLELLFFISSSPSHKIYFQCLSPPSFQSLQLSKQTHLPSCSGKFPAISLITLLCLFLQIQSLSSIYLCLLIFISAAVVHDFNTFLSSIAFYMCILSPILSVLNKMQIDFKK